MDIGELRGLVRKAHQSATRKISRLKNEKGVMLAGGDLDPRRDLGKVKRYTRSQLNAHLARLGEFNSRSTQYVAGVRATPIPKSEWDRYKRVEKQFNDQLKQFRQGVDKLQFHGDALNVGERFDVMIPKKGPSMGGGSMRYWPLDRRSEGVPNVAAIDKLIADVRNKMKPNYASEQETRIRENFAKLLENSGRTDILEVADKLNEAEFSLVWNLSTLVSTLVENYKMIEKMMDGNQQAMEASGLKESFDEMKEVFEWAHKAKIGEKFDFYNKPVKRNRKPAIKKTGGTRGRRKK